MHFHWDVGWPVTHREDVHRQLDVARNVLALHILQKHKQDACHHFRSSFCEGILFQVPVR